MKEEQNDKPLSWEFQNTLGYVGGVNIYAEDKEVGIWVEDNYYSFEIPFDKFLEIAEKVKELKKESGRSYERQFKYAKSEKGKAAKHRYYMAHKEEILAKAKEKRAKNV